MANGKWQMDLIDYFDRLYIIHLPEREDRYRALKQELAYIGIDMTASKVRITCPPRPEDANGFPSRAVYSNFLCHLKIFRESAKDNIERVWILEDDAIFRRCLRRKDEQEKLVQQLASSDWDLCYLGHPLKSELRGYPFGLVPFSKGFKWVHCYCVNGRVLNKVVQYLEETMMNPSGHPRGGRMYIDGALTLFRQFHPEVVCLVSNPSLSTQKGSISSLAGGHWYDHLAITKPLVTAARSVRDEIWRWSY